MNFREDSILKNLTTYATLRGEPTTKAVSIKFRPTAKISGLSDRYVYSDEYKALAREFDLHPTDSTGFNTPQAYTFRDDIVFLEHETGPEIIAFIKDFGDAAAPFLSVIEIGALAAGVAGWLRRKIRKNCEEKNPERYYHDVRYLRIETRTIGSDGQLKEIISTTIRIDAANRKNTIARAVEKSLDDRHNP